MVGDDEELFFSNSNSMVQVPVLYYLIIDDYIVERIFSIIIIYY